MTATAQKAAEPSMEEILASIRRIIAEDQTRAKFSPAKPGPAPVANMPRAAAQSLAAIDQRAAASVMNARAPDDAEEPALSSRAEVIDGMDHPESSSTPELVAFAPGADPVSGSPWAAQEERAPDSESQYAEAAIDMSAHVSAPAGHENDAPDTLAEDAMRESPSDQSATDAPRERSEPEDRFDESSASADEDKASHGGVGERPEPQIQPPEQIRPTFEPHIPRLEGPAQLTRPMTRAREEAQMLSGEADAAVTRAFNSLSQTILSENARTLEDLVKEMLRPLLTAWLDDNLPPLVERLVRAEIERVARGRP